MENVRVAKLSLTQILQKNRAEHREIFLKAQEKYRELVIQQLDEQLKQAMDGKMPKWQRITMMSQPQDHTADYDRVLHMLELSVDDVVELSSQAFRHYVEDDWEWSRSWAMSNSSYTTSPKFAKYVGEEE